MTLVPHQAARRYSNGSVASSRHLSSHKSPLESRRRLGKRHMTGAIPSSGFDIPSWYFEGPQGSNTWQWQAPTSPERRRAKAGEWNMSSLVDRLRIWLEASDADKPFLQIPPEAAEAEAKEEDDLISIIEDISTTSTADAAPHLHREIFLFRQSICDLAAVDRKSLWTLGTQCYQSLQARIEAGAASTEEILQALDPFDGRTKRKIAQPRLVDGLASKFRRVVLSAIQAAQAHRAGAISEDAWMSLATKLSKLQGEENRTKLFPWALGMMPPSIRDRVPAGCVFQAIQPFISDLARRRNFPPALLARAARIGSMLGNLTETQRSDVYASMAAYCRKEQGRDGASQKGCGTRFAWLLVGAFDRGATWQTFTAAHREFVSGGLSLNGMQLWHLIVARLVAMDVVKATTHSQAASTARHISVTKRWASLLAAVAESEKRQAGLRELFECLKAMKEHETLVSALTMPLSLDRTRPTQVISFGAAEQSEALVLRGTTRGEQDWTIWGPYIQDMIADPRTEPSVWRALAISETRRRSHAAKRSAAAESSSSSSSSSTPMMDLLGQMGHWYLGAAHLSERQALRRVQMCALHQKLLAGRVSSRMLASVATAVTRELERGEWGRSARLDWLVGLAAAHQGEEQARGVLAGLRGWRGVIAQRGRSG